MWTQAIEELRLLSCNKKQVACVKRDHGQFRTEEFRAGQRCNEDKIFTNPKIWEFLTRGICLVYVGDELIHINCGPRKFGEETGSIPTCQLGDNERDVYEVYTSKENGENCRLSFFRHNMHTYICVGSKNVCVIMSLTNLDLSQYQEDRYGFAKQMANTLSEQLCWMSDENRQAMIDFMVENQLTLVCEFCSTNSQHLVDYSDYWSDKPDIVFGFILTGYSPSSNGVVFESPDITYNKLGDWGFPRLRKSVKVLLSDLDARKKVRTSFFTEDNSEGAVVYVISESAGHQKVRKMYKFKNWRYVCARAAREKIRVNASVGDIKSRLNNVYGFLSKRANSLDISLSEFEQYKQTLLEFNAFVHSSVAGQSFDSGIWVNLWNQFNSLDSAEKSRLLAEFLKEQKALAQVQLFAVGMPGSGKTSLLSACVELCKQQEIAAKYVDQDMFAVKSDKAGGKINTSTAKLYHKEIGKITSESHKLVALGKSHHTKKIRGNALAAIKSQKLVNVVFGVFDDNNKLNITETLSVAIQRINKRGLGHTSLYPSSQLSKILHDFSRSFQPLSPEEIAAADGRVIYVDMHQSREYNIRHIFEKLSQFELNPLDLSDMSAENIANILAQIDKNQHDIAENNKNMNSGMDSKMLYWSADIFDSNSILNHPDIANLLVIHCTDSDWKVYDRLHSTLLWVGADPVPDLDQTQYSAMEGQSLSLTPIGVYWDDNCVTLKLQADFPCNNAVPHITLATKGNTTPVYSNELLANSEANFLLLDKIDPCQAVVIRH